MSSVPKRCAQGRVAVPTTRGCTLRPVWQCHPHCHSMSNVRAARPHTATRRRAYRDGALRPEWQCHPHGTARSGPSGSAPHTATRRRTHGAARPHTATRRRAYRDGALRPEWQCRPRGTARSGPSGSAAHTATRRRAYGLHALTLPLDVERTDTVRPGPSGRAAEAEGGAPVGGDRRPGSCSGVPSRRPGGLPTTRVPRARGVRREARGARARQTRVAEARGGPGGTTARGARGTCARQEPPRVRPGPARRPRRCERCAEIDEYVAQK